MVTTKWSALKVSNSVHSIEIISDVSCPWCVIGYRALQAAIDLLDANEKITISWRAFELNPNMSPQGQDKNEHIQAKYGFTKERAEVNRQYLIDRGLSVDYAFRFAENNRVYNTFNAHRLVHWASGFNRQTELKLALFDLYFQQGGNPSDESALINCVSGVGLDVQAAKIVLSSNRYADEVRAEQEKTQQQGITSVPAFILDDKYLISGGQPKDVFVEAIKKLISNTA